MLRITATLALGVVVFAATSLSVYGAPVDGHWPSWRGPQFTGVARTGNPPLTWSETENIKWKVKLPGSSSSTPIVWGSRLFFQTAVAVEPDPAELPPTQPLKKGAHMPKAEVAYKFNIVCLDRNTGDTLWVRTVREEVPHQGHHPNGTHAAYSPVTDGKLLWANFGSRGLHCFDLDGNHQWGADLIKMEKRRGFGEGSSPVLAGGAVAVLMDHEGDSKIFAFDKSTGKLIWEKDRDDPSSWSTPLAVDVGGKIQIITSATNLIRAYDAETGGLEWKCSGQTHNVVPTPVADADKVYCMSGDEGFALQAIKLGRTGDLSGSDAIAWEINDGTAYVASPLLYEDRIYFVKDVGISLSCYDTKTGTPIFVDKKLDTLRQVLASPVAVAGRVYLTDLKGNTLVIKHSDAFEVLATNTLDDSFCASPVIVGDELYLKGKSHLYCIAEQ